MQDREIYAEIYLENEIYQEPLYYITLGMRFNDKPKKSHEILARVTGTDLIEAIHKFNVLICLPETIKYVANRVDGSPYTPFPMATKKQL